MLRSTGLIFAKPKKTPLLSDVDKKKRLDFCIAQLACDEYKQYFFSDEKYFTIVLAPASAWMLPSRRAEFTAPHQAHPPKVMCWLAIGYFSDGRRFSNVFWYAENSRQDSTLYCQTLQHAFAPMCWNPLLNILQQDNAPSHKSKATLKYIQEQTSFTVLDGWPPRSPDLNVIENMWSWLAQKLSLQNPPLKNVAELKHAVEALLLTPKATEVAEALLQSYKHRLEKCIALKGAWTGY